MIKTRTRSMKAVGDCPFEMVDEKETPATPTVVPVCLPNNDTVTIPEMEGVIYTDTGWVDGKRTITAEAAPGYDLAGDVEWTFTDVPVAGCPDEGPAFSYTSPEELAYTGASSTTGGLAALAILLMATGAALVARKARV